MERSAFDALFTTERLQILKVLLPCLPPDKQGGLAVYIKMQELFYTMDLVRNSPHRLRNALGPAPTGASLFEQILPFCSPSQRDQIRQFQQMSQQMDSMREMMEMVQMMQSMFPEGMNPEDMDISQMMGMFSAGMGTPDFSAFSAQDSTAQHGDGEPSPTEDKGAPNPDRGSDSALDSGTQNPDRELSPAPDSGTQNPDREPSPAPGSGFQTPAGAPSPPQRTEEQNTYGEPYSVSNADRMDSDGVAFPTWNTNDRFPMG